MTDTCTCPAGRTDFDYTATGAHHNPDRCPLSLAQQAKQCNCYPGGFSPETYEGPQHHCPVHGHGNDLPISECPDCLATS
ncbi:hypothetical protein ACFPJ1_40475 [Kribbella qitaiheensis]|uniref:hypothetical protein n=1 Tax=Kribbella qitaiheensis TaxID=1544730 RepID=UPI00360D2182